MIPTLFDAARLGAFLESNALAKGVSGEQSNLRSLDPDIHAHVAELEGDPRESPGGCRGAEDRPTGISAGAAQVQITTDQVKGGLARLAGVEVPKWDDNEKTFGELCARVDKALDYTKTFKPAQFDGAETRDIELKFPQATLTFKGRDYLLNFVLPNFYFHLTAAYAILRHNGVPLGKRDFVGG